MVIVVKRLDGLDRYAILMWTVTKDVVLALSTFMSYRTFIVE